MNLVGCMIGFYIYPANVEPTKDVILNKEGTKFVPWNEISEEIILELWPSSVLESITKSMVIDMCESDDLFPPKTTKHTTILRRMASACRYLRIV